MAAQDPDFFVPFEAPSDPEFFQPVAAQAALADDVRSAAGIDVADAARHPILTAARIGLNNLRHPVAAARGAAAGTLDVMAGVAGTTRMLANNRALDNTAVGWAAKLAALSPLNQPETYDAERYELTRTPEDMETYSGEWFAHNVGRMVPQMAATTGASFVAGPAGGFSVAAAMEGGAAYNDAKAAGATEREAQTTGITVGVINGALEYLPIDLLLRGVGKKAVQKASATATRRMLHLVGLAARQATTEGLTEGIQSIVEDMAAEMNYRPTAPWRAKMAKALQSAVLGAVAGGLFAGGAASVAHGRQVLNSPEAPRYTGPVDPPGFENAPKREGGLAVRLEAARRAIGDDTFVQTAVAELTDPQPDPQPDIPDVMDAWLADRQEAEVEADIRAMNHRDEVKATVGERHYGPRSRAASRAMQVYIDLKNNPDAVAEHWDNLTPEQQAIVDQAQNLPPEQKAIADQIIRENAEMGVDAMDAGVIANVLDNYTARIWRIPDKARGDKQAVFSTSTPRARQRSLTSVLEGWAKGYELQVDGAIEAQAVAKRQVAQVQFDRQLIASGTKAGLFSTSRGRGMAAVKHPNFAKWDWAGTVEEGKSYSPDVFITGDGQMFQRRQLYAPQALARKLNNILGESALNELWGVRAITKANAIIKQMILMTSLFHHQAFLRSSVLAGNAVNPVQAYQQGREAIRQFTSELRELVRAGMTLFQMQDYDAALAQEKTRIGKMLDKVPGLSQGKSWLADLKDRQTQFLFQRFGGFLKAHTALIEYRKALDRNARKLQNGEITRHEIARRVAEAVNDDFGGLNLQRMGRNPTLQHLFRLFFLAPDWTESNVRHMLKTFERGEGGRIARAMWARVLVRGMGLTILANLGLAAFDDRTFWKRYQDQWREGRLRWLDIDITPIYRALGGDREKRKHFSFIGHFRDPVKFVLNPVRSAKHKSSVIGGFALEALTGSDWADRPFTTWREFLGVDDKGVYTTRVPGKHVPGMPKGGKFKGRTVKTPYDASGPLEWAQIPSYVASELMGSMPIQVQAGMGLLAGELDAFDAITRSLGIMTSTTYKPRQD